VLDDSGSEQSAVAACNGPHELRVQNVSNAASNRLLCLNIAANSNVLPENM
jgi:hypothetical protein